EKEREKAVAAATTEKSASPNPKKKISHLSDTELDEDYNWKYTPLLDSVSRNTSTATASAKIPKIIIQIANTSSSSSLPSKYQELRNSWVSMNPDYRVKLFSDKDMDYFVRYKCSEIEKKAFFTLSTLMQRVFFFRFLYLKYNGGVYAEIDSECRVPVKSWNLERDGSGPGLVIGFKDQHHNDPSYQQSAMMAIPQHPLIVGFTESQVADILSRPPQYFEKDVDFNGYFKGRFNKYVNTELSKQGIQPETDFKKLSWYGHVEFDDVLIHGNERFSASNPNNIVVFVANRGGLWNDIWREETVATTKL
ncbi:UNVERIFIED_CONTAM: membrane-bound alpha-1,6- mannosyltransferase Initiation-specific, partial [Siphonaria sp. JEL0065]